jgi:very-short-patch-repair endonuclease
MKDVISRRCEECNRQPSYNYPDLSGAVKCSDHALEGMVRMFDKKCLSKEYNEKPIYGISGQKAKYCEQHKKENHVNIFLDNKCSNVECMQSYDFIIDEEKYCYVHCPEESMKCVSKRLCRYCDITEESTHVCNECKSRNTKKEYAVIRYIKKKIKLSSIHNSSSMLQGCSKRRPDLYYELPKHVVIVEIDENQHKAYEEQCECSRINEIVNGIGGKSVIFVRFNPDRIMHKKKKLVIDMEEKLELLVKTIKEELKNNYDTFIVKVIQLYYDYNFKEYQDREEEEITNIVCI